MVPEATRAARGAEAGGELSGCPAPAGPRRLPDRDPPGPGNAADRGVSRSAALWPEEEGGRLGHGGPRPHFQGGLPRAGAGGSARSPPAAQVAAESPQGRRVPPFSP